MPPAIEMARATQEEKKQQLDTVRVCQAVHIAVAATEIGKLKKAAASGENVFTALMSAARVCSLGQVTGALNEIGGKYWRNV